MTPQAIKAARCGLGLTQPELAQATGVHYKTIAHYEDATRKPVKRGQSLPKLERFFAAKGVIVTAEAVTIPIVASP